MEEYTRVPAAAVLGVASHRSRLINCERTAHGQKYTMLMHGPVSSKVEEGGDERGEIVMGTGKWDLLQPIRTAPKCPLEAA